MNSNLDNYHNEMTRREDMATALLDVRVEWDVLYTMDNKMMSRGECVSLLILLIILLIQYLWSCFHHKKAQISFSSIQARDNGKQNPFVPPPLGKVIQYLLVMMLWGVR